MSPPIGRRKLMALGAAGLTALAGCQSGPLIGSRTPTRIVISNLLDRPQEIWVQLTRGDDADPIGESVSVYPDTTTVLEREVPVDTYRFTASVDDPARALKRRVRWEITNEPCSATGIVTLVSRAAEPELVVDTASCE